MLTYNPDIEVSGVKVWSVEEMFTNVLLLGSVDALDWYDVSMELQYDGSAILGYLWVIFSDDGSGSAPQVREIQVDIDGE